MQKTICKDAVDCSIGVYMNTYYIYQRNEYGFAKQLGFSFQKEEAIKKAKQYANNLFGGFTIEVHYNGVKSEKIFETTNNQ